MKKAKTDAFLLAFLLLLLLHLNYAYVIKELPDIYSDYNGHAFVFLPKFFSRTTFWDGWKMVPYCMWHLVALFFYKILLFPLETSAACASCVFVAFSYLIFYWLLQKLSLKENLENGGIRSALLSFCLCIVQPISIPFWDATAYSVNPLYSPTQMCVRGFSLLCFFLVCDLWGIQKDPNYQGRFFPVERGIKKYYAALAVLLFLSAMAKPTFAEVFIPAVAFSMLFTWIRKILRKDGTAKPYFQHCLYTLCCAIPTLAYIFSQFAVYFLLGGSHGGGGSLIITGFLEVWNFFSQNVALSLLLSCAFPLFMLLLDPPYFLQSDEGKLSLVCLLIGFLEAAFLGESGPKLLHFNFAWPLMSAMFLFFTVGTMRLLTLEKLSRDRLGKRALLGISWLLFCLHALGSLPLS